jgi:tetratricopeptide (TPR) repeat protein
MLELARVLRSQRKFCEAQKILENARSRYKQFAKVGNHTWFAFYYEMAALKWNTGDLAVSEKFLLPIFPPPRWTSSIPYWIKGNSTWLMAHVLEDSGRIEEAATWYEKLFYISIERHGIQSKQAISNCRDWGFCYAQLGFFGKAISVFEKVIQDIELGRGRGLEPSDQCLQWLRGYIARVMEMQKEKEASEVDEMPNDQYMSEDEEMPDNEDIIEDIDLYGPESKLRLVRSEEAAEIFL